MNAKVITTKNSHRVGIVSPQIAAVIIAIANPKTKFGLLTLADATTPITIPSIIADEILLSEISIPNNTPDRQAKR